MAIRKHLELKLFKPSSHTSIERFIHLLDTLALEPSCPAVTIRAIVVQFSSVLQSSLWIVSDAKRTEVSAEFFGRTFHDAFSLFSHKAIAKNQTSEESRVSKSIDMQFHGDLAFTLESVEIHFVSLAQSIAEIVPISGLVPSNAT